MTPEAALMELLARVGAGKGAAILVSEEELGRWPTVAVKAMKLQLLLVKARPAASVVCPGCEQECLMPVHTPPGGPRGPVSFIVCDKRSDVNRVSVAAERLTQWLCDPGAICRFIAESLGLRRSDKRSVSAELWEIGIAAGNKRSQMVCLQADGELALVIGKNVTPLAELVRYQEDAYSMGRTLIQHLVDSSTTADDRYTPTDAARKAHKLETQAMYKSWQTGYRTLKKTRPDMSDVWYSQQIAKMAIANDKSPETIRKHIKR